MRYGNIASCLLISAAAAVACRTNVPRGSPQESTSPAPKRAIVPLALLGDQLAVCQLKAGQPLPSWAVARPGEFFSVTHTPDEVSLIVAHSRAPGDAKCERGFRLIKVQGPLALNLVGIIAGLSGTLADAGVSIFAFSTYDTDYVMVKEQDLERAVAALRQAGYEVRQPQ